MAVAVLCFGAVVKHMKRMYCHYGSHIDSVGAMDICSRGCVVWPTTIRGGPL
jgi:hypothetical protein